MPITRSLVELMNGTIHVESEKGKGTTFTVTVTLDTSEREQDMPAAYELSPQSMRVLVIDDDRIALEHAGIVLGQIGIHCETAESGSEGIKKILLRHVRSEDFHLILVDWKMPDLDGVETTMQFERKTGQ